MSLPNYIPMKLVVKQGRATTSEQHKHAMMKEYSRTCILISFCIQVKLSNAQQALFDQFHEHLELITTDLRQLSLGPQDEPESILDAQDEPESVLDVEERQFGTHEDEEQDKSVTHEETVTIKYIQ